MRLAAGLVLALAGCGHAPSAAPAAPAFAGPPALMAPPAGAACVLVRPLAGGAQDCLVPASDGVFQGRAVKALSPAYYYPSIPGLALQLRAADDSPERPGAWVALIRLDRPERAVLAQRFVPSTLGAGASVGTLSAEQWRKLYPHLKVQDPFRPPVQISGF